MQIASREDHPRLVGGCQRGCGILTTIQQRTKYGRPSRRRHQLWAPFFVTQRDKVVRKELRKALT